MAPEGIKDTYKEIHSNGLGNNRPRALVKDLSNGGKLKMNTEVKEENIKSEEVVAEQTNEESSHIMDVLNKLVDKIDSLSQKLDSIEERTNKLEETVTGFDKSLEVSVNYVSRIYKSIYDQDLGAVQCLRNDITNLHKSLVNVNEMAMSCHNYASTIYQLNSKIDPIYRLVKDKAEPKSAGSHTRSNGLSDVDLLEYLKKGYTYSEISEQCRAKGMEYTAAGIAYRVNKLIDKKTEAGEPIITRDEIKNHQSERRAAIAREEAKALELKSHKPVTAEIEDWRKVETIPIEDLKAEEEKHMQEIKDRVNQSLHDEKVSEIGKYRLKI